MSRELLQQFKDSQNLTQSKLAPMLGVSSATVSQYLSGVYGGDVATLDKKVRELVERANSRKVDIKTGFVLTKSARKTLSVCEDAHTLGDIRLVIGEAGLGKTMAIKEYSEKIKGVILIESEPTFSPKILLVQLCHALGVIPSRSNHDNLSAIKAKLTDSERLIIIDEAELLSYKCLEIIRRIHDMTGVGVVLAGMPRLVANLKGKSGEYKQLYSRVGFVHDLGGELTADDVGVLAMHLLGTDEHNGALVKACKGNARRLSKLIRTVNLTAKRSNKPISDEMITAVGLTLIG
ncbi:transcriptional regulator [Moraxella nonliquefaciens]|uniref:HTH cro/C1-type domain-containing protein n=1 Tax=Moraxella lacunata TaxID=477 RepID=A0A1B8Q7Z4_MORLA|nr:MULTISPECIES: AAA family ATPase [Moraxella]MDI4482773.1 transcriptional regulator [Moraxella lacunata]MDI4500792.1 transcriptional regulator [Moraxella nonliquefaciens]MDI4507270.1 transcriptional regulator [Moraxella lacunata]OBX61410.1 hypothetical protein A9Z63_08215 [Moraxella lacunata]OBX67240.1 hypothetical protein A9309_01125 [Moraxella lacunata]